MTELGMEEEIGMDSSECEPTTTDTSSSMSIYKSAERRLSHLHGVFHPARLTGGEKHNDDGSPWADGGGAGSSGFRYVEKYESPCEGVETLYDNFEATVSNYPNAPFLGTRTCHKDGSAGAYMWETYQEASMIRRNIGSGLMAMGIPTGAHIGLYSINCREWILCDLACHAYSMVDVPLYDTLGSDAVSYITNHAELQAVFCSSNVLPTLLQSIENCPSLRLIVVFGSWNASEEDLKTDTMHGNSNRLKIVQLSHLEATGRMRPMPPIPPHSKAPATICYTSGTTGTPKGVLLTHANMIANSAATCQIVRLQVNDVAISYLPMAHIYERVNSVTLIHYGCAVGFYKGDVMQLLDDIVELKPTLFSSVPRLWNRIYDRIQAQLAESSFVKRMLFQAAYSAGRAALKQKKAPPFWTKPIFNALRARLGGRVRLMITGASPLSADIMEFLRVCFGTTIEGYGMTETACAISLTELDDPTVGHVGIPVRCSEIKLDDIPEMKYYNSDKPFPRGEICIRGPSVFSEYYKSPQETSEVIDSDGWFHTGDVGMRLPGGKLKIIDRKKNIFKLAQGEYVAPEKIENVYMKCPFVLQVMVYGDSLKHKLVAVVVPDPETVQPWASTKKIAGSFDDLCCNALVISAILKQMQKQGEAAGLNGFEQVFAIHLESKAWSVEDGQLTPTMKIKRPILRDIYQSEIDDLYASL